MQKCKFLQIWESKDQQMSQKVLAKNHNWKNGLQVLSDANPLSDHLIPTQPSFLQTILRI